MLRDYLSRIASRNAPKPPEPEPPEPTRHQLVVAVQRAERTLHEVKDWSNTYWAERAVMKARKDLEDFDRANAVGTGRTV